MKVSIRDLELAQLEIERMAETSQFPDFEASWQHFLIRIERAWEHAESKLGKHPKGQAWISRHACMRKKDPLLRYLKQARNSETHAVAPTLAKDVIVSLKEKLGRQFVIEGIEASVKDEVLTFNIISSDESLELDASVQPGDPKLVRIQNRGAWFNPPTEHLGSRIKDLHPVGVAMLGIEYYKRCISEAEGIMNTRQSPMP